jgi:hypothetical protein
MVAINHLADNKADGTPMLTWQLQKGGSGLGHGYEPPLLVLLRYPLLLLCLLCSPNIDSTS